MTEVAAVKAGATVPRSRRVMLVGTALVTVTPIVSHTFGRSTYGLLLPAMEDTMGLNHAQTGLGGTVIYAAYLLGVIAVALLSRRFEPITILRGGVAIAGLGLVWMATVHSLPALMFGLLLTGGAGAGIWITSPGMVSASVAPQRRGVMIGLLTASVGFGTFVLGIGTTAARQSTGNELLWRPVWMFEAVVTAFILLGLVLVARPPRTEVVSARGFSLDRLRSVPNWKRVTAAYALFAAVGAGISPFLVRALQSDAGLSKAGAASVFAAMSLLAIPGAPLLGALSDRVGRKPVMVFVLGAAGTGTAVVALGHGVVAVLGTFLFGSVWSSYPTLVATYVRDHTEARGFSEALATMTIFYGAAALSAPFLTGWLADLTGHFRAPFVGLSALCLCGAALMAGLPTRSRR